MQQAGYSSVVSLLQGIYYLVTGLWPIFSRRSFEKVTGPKVDFWLVRTTGALISAVGAALALAGWRRRVTPETALLAVGSAAALGGSDVIYSTKGRIAKIYLLEALAEAGLVLLWLVGLLLDSRSNRSSVLQLFSSKHERT